MSVAEEFAARLQTACGIKRTRNADLDREAAKRAVEARTQVGLTGQSPIWPHPTGEELRTRLDWPSHISVLELATWNYMWSDSIGAAVNGLVNSPAHREWLVRSDYPYWGVGVHIEDGPSPRPSGMSADLWKRWYFIVFLANNVPKPLTQPVLKPGLCPSSFTLRNPRQSWIVVNGGTNAVNVRLSPRLAADQIDFSTGPTGPLRCLYLGEVKGDSWSGSTAWSALWLPERGGFRYVHSLLHSSQSPVL